MPELSGIGGLGVLGQGTVKPWAAPGVTLSSQCTMLGLGLGLGLRQVTRRQQRTAQCLRCVAEGGADRS